MKFVEQLINAENYIGGQGVNKNEITAAEDVLDLHFSKEYSEYLSTVGVGAFKEHELTGITDIKYLNVVTVTKAQREFNSLVPKNLYVIEEANIDFIVLWQDERGTVYQSSHGLAPYKVANSLEEYYFKKG